MGIGVTNALAEESRWRGVPLAVFPDRKVLGWLWPSLGFTTWHLVRSQSIPMRAAQSSGSVLAVSIAHAAIDSCGVRAVLFRS